MRRCLTHKIGVCVITKEGVGSKAGAAPPTHGNIPEYIRLVMIHIHNRRERSVTKHALPANETKRVCSVTKHTLPANETIYARLFFKVPQGEAAYVVGSIATIDNKLRTHHYVYAPALVSW
jgi:hypothetical protein